MMSQAEIEQIRTVLRAYKQKKAEVLEPLWKYRQDVKDGKRPPYFEDEIIIEVYSELDTCFERQQFIKFASRTHNDPEFERCFSAVHAEIFFDRPINPLEL